MQRHPKYKTEVWVTVVKGMDEDREGGGGGGVYLTSLQLPLLKRYDNCDRCAFLPDLPHICSYWDMPIWHSVSLHPLHTSQLWPAARDRGPGQLHLLLLPPVTGQHAPAVIAPSAPVLPVLIL